MAKLTLYSQWLTDKGLEKKLKGVSKGEDVRRLLLWNNHLTHLPQLQGKQQFNYLLELNMSDNDITAVDPAVLPPNLESLVLYNNRLLVMADYRTMPRLQYLDLRRNKLSGPFSGILLPLSITWLLLSDNEVTSISEMAHLTKLESLFLNKNRLKDVSGQNFPPNIGLMDLSDNNIHRTDNLHHLKQLRKLYLSNNKIKKLKSLPPHIVTVRLDNNPLMDKYGALINQFHQSDFSTISSSPLDMLTAGYEHMLGYSDLDTYKIWDDLEKQALVQTSTARLLMCGKYCNGKSSLARSLVHNIPYTARIDDRTRVVNYYSWVISDDTTVPLFDLGGHLCYQQLAHLFHSNSPNNLLVLVHEIKSSDYQTTCQWITDVISRSPLSHLLIALTKSDGLEEKEKLILKDKFKENIVPYLQKEIKALRHNEIGLRDSSTIKHVSSVLQKYKAIKQSITDESIIHMVSCQSMDGFLPLRESILDIIKRPECRVDLPTEAHQLYVQLGKLGVERTTKGVNSKDKPLTVDRRDDENPEKETTIDQTVDVSNTSTKRSISQTPAQESTHAVSNSISTISIPQTPLDGATHVVSSVLSTGSIPQTQLEGATHKCRSIKAEGSNNMQTSANCSINYSTHTDLIQREPSDLDSETSEAVVLDTESGEAIEQETITKDSKSLQFVTLVAAEEQFKEIIAKTRTVSDEEVTRKLKHCLSLLNAHGLIIWYQGSLQLENFIFNDLHSFVNVLKSLFHHDIEETFSFSSLSDDVQVKLLDLGIEEDQYSSLIQKLLDEGLLSVHLLNTFAMQWGFESHLESLIALLQHLNIAYLVPTKDEDLNIVDQFMLFPWYIMTTAPPEKWKHVISELNIPNKDFQTLHVTFSGFLPISFFNNLCVAIEKELGQKHDDQIRIIWKNGIYARINKIQLLIEHIINHTNSEKDVIHLCVRSSLDVHCISESWEIIHHSLVTVKALTSTWWPGIVTSKYLHCPHCEITCKDKSHRWIIGQHIDKVCKVNQMSECKQDPGHYFPGALIYPLPSDIKAANACVKALKDYMKDPSMWGKVELKSSDRSREKSSQLHLPLSDVKDPSLRKISEHIGNQWRSLGTRLGFSKAQLDNIRADNHMHREDAIFEMLVKWRQTKDGNLGQLQKALNDAGLQISILHNTKKSQICSVM